MFFSERQFQMSGHDGSDGEEKTSQVGVNHN